MAWNIICEYVRNYSYQNKDVYHCLGSMVNYQSAAVSLKKYVFYNSTFMYALWNFLNS